MSAPPSSAEAVLVSVTVPGGRPASFWRRSTVPGATEGGTPVLALAGLGLDGRAFEDVLALGDDRDLVLSNFANEPDEPRQSMDDFVEEALRIFDAAGHADSRAVVVGSSFGGMVAQALTLAHPERVAALVLIGTGAGWSSLPLRLRVLSGLHGLVGRRLYPRVFTTIMTPPLKYNAHALRDRLRVQMMHRTKGYVGDCLHAMRGFDPRAHLGSITAPTLVLHGDGDQVFAPARGRELAGAIPDARYVEIPRCGHLPQSTHPDRVIEEVRSLLNEASA